jgi:hypothetical protein
VALSTPEALIAVLTQRNHLNIDSEVIDAMQGIQVFKTLADAIKAGFHVYDKTEHGYLVRTHTSQGWAFAIALVGKF